MLHPEQSDCRACVVLLDCALAVVVPVCIVFGLVGLGLLICV